MEQAVKDSFPPGRSGEVEVLPETCVRMGMVKSKSTYVTYFHLKLRRLLLLPPTRLSYPHQTSLFEVLIEAENSGDYSTDLFLGGSDDGPKRLLSSLETSAGTPSLSVSTKCFPDVARATTNERLLASIGEELSIEQGGPPLLSGGGRENKEQEDSTTTTWSHLQQCKRPWAERSTVPPSSSSSKLNASSFRNFSPSSALQACEPRNSIAKDGVLGPKRRGLRRSVEFSDEVFHETAQIGELSHASSENVSYSLRDGETTPPTEARSRQIAAGASLSRSRNGPSAAFVHSTEPGAAVEAPDEKLGEEGERSPLTARSPGTPSDGRSGEAAFRPIGEIVQRSPAVSVFSDDCYSKRDLSSVNQRPISTHDFVDPVSSESTVSVVLSCRVTFRALRSGSFHLRQTLQLRDPGTKRVAAVVDVLLSGNALGKNAGTPMLRQNVYEIGKASEDLSDAETEW